MNILIYFYFLWIVIEGTLPGLNQNPFIQNSKIKTRKTWCLLISCLCSIGFIIILVKGLVYISCKFVSDLRQVIDFLRLLWFSPVTLVSSTNKTDRHDIGEILLKVALNTINQPTNQPFHAQSSIYKEKIINRIGVINVCSRY
jgi:hypothetical protein